MSANVAYKVISTLTYEQMRLNCLSRYLMLIENVLFCNFIDILFFVSFNVNLNLNKEK